MCEEEADICLSRDARLYSSLIYGIISNDSDCAIMRGVRWIPASSLTLQWHDSRRGQAAVYVDASMRGHFMSSRERRYGNREQPAAALSTSTFVASLRQPVVLTAVRCQVWTNSAVMAALSLSNYSQLVNVAMLAGNDFTREYAHLWWRLATQTAGRSKVDRWAQFVSQSAQREKKAEEYGPMTALLSQSKELRRAFRQSRAIYEGTDEPSVTANLDHVATPSLISSAHSLGTTAAPIDFHAVCSLCCAIVERYSFPGSRLSGHHRCCTRLPARTCLSEWSLLSPAARSGRSAVVRGVMKWSMRKVTTSDRQARDRPWPSPSCDSIILRRKVRCGSPIYPQSLPRHVPPRQPSVHPVDFEPSLLASHPVQHTASLAGPALQALCSFTSPTCSTRSSCRLGM